MDVDPGEEQKEEKTGGDPQASGWTPADVRKHQRHRHPRGHQSRRGASCSWPWRVCRPSQPLSPHTWGSWATSGSTTICRMPQPSQRLAPTRGLKWLLSWKYVLALGFKRNTNAFRDQLRAVTPRDPRSKYAVTQRVPGDRISRKPKTKRFWTLPLKNSLNHKESSLRVSKL